CLPSFVRTRRRQLPRKWASSRYVASRTVARASAIAGALTANIGSYPASQGPTPDPTRPPASGGLLGRGFRCLSGLRPDGTPAPRRPSDVTATVLPGAA